MRKETRLEFNRVYNNFNKHERKCAKRYEKFNEGIASANSKVDTVDVKVDNINGKVDRLENTTTERDAALQQSILDLREDSMQRTRTTRRIVVGIGTVVVLVVIGMGDAATLKSVLQVIKVLW